jgi:hypothetical protein
MHRRLLVCRGSPRLQRPLRESAVLLETTRREVIAVCGQAKQLAGVVMISQCLGLPPKIPQQSGIGDHGRHGLPKAARWGDTGAVGATELFEVVGQPVARLPIVLERVDWAGADAGQRPAGALARLRCRPGPVPASPGLSQSWSFR